MCAERFPWQGGVAVGLILGLAAPAPAADYWPHPEGAVYTYENADDHVLQVTYEAAGTRVSHLQTPTYGYSVTEILSEDANGDMVLDHIMGYFDGGIDPEYFRDLGGEFVLLDLPLTVGKSWLSVIDTDCCYGPCQIGLSATVAGPAQVTVPAGEFPVIEVDFEYHALSCTVDLYSGTIALHESVGPVVLPGGFELVSIDGVVGVDDSAWGTIKALYR